MSSDNSDEWRFSPDDVGLSDDDSTSTTMTDSNESSVTDNIDISNVILLPVIVAAAYAFVEKAATLAAVEMLIGAGTLAAAITEALFIAGAVVVAGFGVLALFGVACILGGLVRRSGILLGIGVIIGLAFGVMWAGATFVFAQFPLLVGAILTFNAVFYCGELLVLLLKGIGVIATFDV
jgi:hypothetical protein